MVLRVWVIFKVLQANRAGRANPSGPRRAGSKLSSLGKIRTTGRAMTGRKTARADFVPGTRGQSGPKTNTIKYYIFSV